MNLHKRKTKRSNKKKRKRSTLKRRIESERKREPFYGSLVILGIIVAAIAGGWYLLQPKGQEHPETLALDFSLTDLDGNAFRLNDFGGKVVVIDFMSTTCGPCRLSMPELKDVWNEYEDRIVMMSISISAPPFDDTDEMLRSWVSEWEATWIHAKDTTGVMLDYRVTGIPMVVIIDKDGYIRFTHVPPLSPISAETISQEIEELL